MKNILLALPVLLAVTACDTLDHFQQPPQMSGPGSLTQVPPTDQLSPQLMAAQPAQTQWSTRATGSLWRAGAKTFFRDPRARSIGDLLTVQVSITEQAELNNKAQLQRDSSNSMSSPGLFAPGTVIGSIFPFMHNIDPSFSTQGSEATQSTGDIKRTDTIKVNVATTVIRVLPNNNLEIAGSQEIRVNDDLREVGVRGIVRPEDIKSTNTVSSDQVAEARIVYGGRGVAADLQRPRWGQDVMSRLQPF